MNRRGKRRGLADMSAGPNGRPDRGGSEAAIKLWHDSESLWPRSGPHVIDDVNTRPKDEPTRLNNAQLAGRLIIGRPSITKLTLSTRWEPGRESKVKFFHSKRCLTLVLAALMATNSCCCSRGDNTPTSPTSRNSTPGQWLDSIKRINSNAHTNGQQRPGGSNSTTNNVHLTRLITNRSDCNDQMTRDPMNQTQRNRETSLKTDDKQQFDISTPQSTQLVPRTMSQELTSAPTSNGASIEPLVTSASKKKKKMMKKKKKMEKKHKEWKKGKKHKKKKYESKKKKGGMSKKKKGKKEKKKWGMEKKGHKKKGNFKKKKWGHKKKMKKGHKKGKKGHKMLKDKGHKKKGFKKVYHKEEWGKKKKWHDVKREKKWNTKQKKWKKKWHQEKGKKYKGKHMKKYHKKNKHGKKYKKEKKSKWKKHKGEKFKKGHKKKKEEYSKKKEGGKKKKMKKEMKKMKKKKG